MMRLRCSWCAGRTCDLDTCKCACHKETWVKVDKE